MTDFRIINADVLDGLATIPDQSIDCIVTSPPYWNLRDYGAAGQIGLEPTFDLWLDRMRTVFAELNRVLSATGTLWVNMGDSYYHGAGKIDLPTKSLIGQPWRLAIALQESGWILRSEIIWSKSNPMPESVRDRPTRAHEYVFLFAKSPNYYYNREAISEPREKGYQTQSESVADIERLINRKRQTGIRVSKPKPIEDPRVKGAVSGKLGREPGWRNLPQPETRSARTVWEFPVGKYAGSHCATFPIELPKRCILAGCPPSGIVLDPFAGAGTTLIAARMLGRSSIGIEISPEYCEEIRERLRNHGQIGLAL